MDLNAALAELRDALHTPGWGSWRRLLTTLGRLRNQPHPTAIQYVRDHLAADTWRRFLPVALHNNELALSVGARRLEAGVRQVIFDPNGSFFGFRRDDGLSFATRAGDPMPLRIEAGASIGAIVHPDGRRVLTATDPARSNGARDVLVWSLERGELLARLPHSEAQNPAVVESLGYRGDEGGWFGGECGPAGMIVTPDGRRLVVCDLGIWVWDLERGELLVAMVEPQFPLMSEVDPCGRVELDWNVDGHLVVQGDWISGNPFWWAAVVDLSRSEPRIVGSAFEGSDALQEWYEASNAPFPGLDLGVPEDALSVDVLSASGAWEREGVRRIARVTRTWVGAPDGVVYEQPLKARRFDQVRVYEAETDPYAPPNLKAGAPRRWLADVHEGGVDVWSFPPGERVATLPHPIEGGASALYRWSRAGRFLYLRRPEGVWLGSVERAAWVFWPEGDAKAMLTFAPDDSCVFIGPKGGDVAWLELSGGDG